MEEIYKTVRDVKKVPLREVMAFCEDTGAELDVDREEAVLQQITIQRPARCRY